MDKHQEKAAPGDLHALLLRDHSELEHLFEELLNAFEADARVEAGKLWSEFDRRLNKHMALEERHILPKFALVDAPEAEALQREHETLRAQLLSLGVGVDLHLVRDEQVEAFIAQLKAHARREDKLMYRFVEDQLRDRVARQLISAGLG